MENWLFTPEMENANTVATALARENRNPAIAGPHLLKALLHDDSGLVFTIEALGKDVAYLKQWADAYIELEPKTSQTSDLSVDLRIKKTYQQADLIRIKRSKDAIDPLSCFAALLQPEVGFTADQLKSLNVSYAEIVSHLFEDEDTLLPDDGSSHPTTEKKDAASHKAFKTVHKYCVNKIQLAAAGKIDPVIGREGEIQSICEIFGRRLKNNVIIVGEPGVGKTALVNGLAIEIAENRVPSYLQNASLYELDVQALVAGASYKGEFEDRLKKVLDELKTLDNAILFIDEIHSLFSSNSTGGSSGADLLKPLLTRGELKIIGATTLEEFREQIENDEALTRRFEKIIVAEPNEKLTFRMLHNLFPRFVEFHGVEVSDAVLKESIRLAKRYLKQRKLPDAAIDLLDHTLSAIKLMNQTAESNIDKADAELNNLIEEIKNNSQNSQIKELDHFKATLQHKIGYLLFSKLKNVPADEHPTSGSFISELKKNLGQLREMNQKKQILVFKNDLAAVVAHRTSIPVGKIQTDEKQRLLKMESEIGKRMVGQDYAVKVIAEAVRESRSGLTKAGKPIGSFFLLGPTGTGKTELAKSLAAFLFDSESSLIRFDMSEFKEEHSAALLYGAPPGYIGYKEGGLLVNKIREKPYSVVLFDEIEKAHSSVFDIFLQILDEGKLHDKLGKEGDFSNAVILFTSNVGSGKVSQAFEKNSERPDLNSIIKEMERYFRPEFLGRLTDIAPFAPLTEEQLLKILDIQLRDLHQALANQRITMKLSSAAEMHLAKAGFSKEFGARPLVGVIRNELRRPLSKKIITGEITTGGQVTVDLKNNEIIFNLDYA